MQKARQDHSHAIKLQKGKTGLMLAVEFDDDNKHKELVATLMEVTKVAGALNMRDEDGLSGIIMASGLSCHTNRSLLTLLTLTHTSALHMASQKGLTGTVKKLVSLGADAALRIDDSGSCMTGMTSLMLAFDNEHEAAAELMEATQLAGALDVQVAHESWFEACTVSGAVGKQWGREHKGGARGQEEKGTQGRGRRGGKVRRWWRDRRRALTCACACLYRTNAWPFRRCTWPVKRDW